MAFGDSSEGPRVVLPSDPIDWPLREGDPAMAALQVRGLPGLPSLLMPIVAEGEFVGLLIIGEPIRGGEFSDADMAQAEALRQLICSALAKGVRLSSPPLSLHGGENSLVPVGSSLAICAFGHLRVLVRREERMQPLRLPSRARQILALLLIRYPEAISSQELMACLWPESDAESAANNLYVAIYSLRRALQPSLRRGQESRFIERQQDRYRLRYGHGIWVDCIAFQLTYRRAVASVERGDAKAACNAFEEALRLISAPFLDDPSLDLPIEVEVARARFNRMAREAAQHVVDISLEEGTWRRAEQALHRVLALNPEDQETRSQLIRLYRQQGMHQLAIQFLRSPAHD
jgi:DNA-binding SARP family transcriptional activator